MDAPHIVSIMEAAFTAKNLSNCLLAERLTDVFSTDEMSFNSLDIDRDWIIRNVSNIVLQAIRDGNCVADSPKKLQKQIESIIEKKTRVIDSYLSDEISKEEFLQIKLRYDTELKVLQDRLDQATAKYELDDVQLLSDLRCTIESIISCKETSEAFLKPLLEYMIIHKDGTVELKLNELATIWKFQLYKVNQYLPDM